jgi:hypothetical protein
MTNEEAKRTLWLYREGIDRAEPEFAEALALAEGDAELRGWMQQQVAIFKAVRGKLSAIEVPPDLRERIVRQRPIPKTTTRWWRPILKIAAALLLLAGLAIFWSRAGAKNNLANYEAYVARLVSGKYRMSFESENFENIRSFLQRNQAPSLYEIPKGLSQTNALGCATLSWSGNPVSMLCFADAQNRKLWLFVARREAIPDSPTTVTPAFAQQAKGFTTATWTSDGYTYVLTMQGNRDDLRDYL